MQKIKKSLLFLLLTVVLVALYISTSLSPALIFKYDRVPNQKFIKIGHRGAAGLAPENTLSAIAKGLENKVDRIEIDVQQTKDGKVVVMHDITVDRTTNGKGLVKEFNYSSLSSLDAGSWFDKKFKNEKVPTLDEAIIFINGQAELIIEIKRGDDFYPDIEENILKIIKENNSEKWCIIHSFYTDILERVHKIDPSIRLHKILVAKFSLLPIIIDKGVEIFNFKDYPYIEEYNLNYYFANKSIIQAIKAQRKKVNVWVVNDQQIIDNLISLGVDGIITDFPNKFN